MDFFFFSISFTLDRTNYTPRAQLSHSVSIEPSVRLDHGCARFLGVLLETPVAGADGGGGRVETQCSTRLEGLVYEEGAGDTETGSEYWGAEVEERWVEEPGCHCV